MMFNKLVDYGRNLIEMSAFGVCQAIGDSVGIQASKIRLYFIYTSFITVGSPFVMYLILAFWMNVRRYLRGPERPAWD